MSESNKGRLIGYWVLTVLVVLSQGISGVMDLIAAAPIVDGLTALGYPPYLVFILGPAKLLGAIALAWRGAPLVKEWAYAGFTFDFLGASLSHALNGDGIDLIAPPLVLLAILVGSYVLRPESRRLT